MAVRPPIICSCGKELPRPIPRICPHCDAEITRIDRSQASSWVPVTLVIIMFLTLLGLIIFLGNYV